MPLKMLAALLVQNVLRRELLVQIDNVYRLQPSREHGMVWYGMVDVCEGWLAAEVSRSRYGAHLRTHNHNRPESAPLASVASLHAVAVKA